MLLEGEGRDDFGEGAEPGLVVFPVGEEEFSLESAGVGQLQGPGPFPCEGALLRDETTLASVKQEGAALEGEDELRSEDTFPCEACVSEPYSRGRFLLVRTRKV